MKQYLAKLRQNSGFSQKEISDALGYSSPQFVSNWERGLSTPPFKTMKKLAAIYNVEFEEIIKEYRKHAIEQLDQEIEKEMDNV